MATKLTDLTEHTTGLDTDVYYVVDLTEAIAADRSKKITAITIAEYINSVRPTIINSDTNLYAQWEAGTDNWTITRLADGFWATITNNPTMTTSALAWTNRAALTYSVDGT